jgi:hypothetical protein
VAFGPTGDLRSETSSPVISVARHIRSGSSARPSGGPKPAGGHKVIFKNLIELIGPPVAHERFYELSSSVCLLVM